MFDRLKIGEFFRPTIERTRKLNEGLDPHGMFGLEQWRKNASGLYVKIQDIPFNNDITNVGKQHMLGSAFLGTTQITQWYMGLIDGTDVTPTIAAADTMASHTGWTEFTDVTQSTRQLWNRVANTGSNQIITNTSSQWTISSAVDPAGQIAGAFICSNSTLNGTTGTLWSAGKFAANVPVQEDDVFKLNYTTGL